MALAAVGAVLVVDALLWGGGSMRHRAVGVLMGTMCCVPLVAMGFAWSRKLLLRLTLLAIPSLVLLLVAEFAVQVWDVQALVPPEIVEDPELGLALKANTGGQDGLGFRNASVPADAEIICIGDSQTYGHGVQMDEAYPARLAQKSGRVVYSMSMGTYGAVQYLALTERALKLEPELIVYGLYFGNDILNAHQAAGLERWRDLRAPDIEYAPYEFPVWRPPPSPNLAMASIDFVAAHSRLAGWLTHVVRIQARQSAMLADTYWHETDAPRWETGAIQTLLTPGHRMPAIDQERPAVRDGLRITKECFARIAALTKSKGVEVAVLYLHTKELYYHELFVDAGDEVGAERLARVETHERAVARELSAHFAQIGVAVIDPSERVLASLRSDRPVWPRTADGHFSASGYDVLADELAAFVARPR